MKKTHLSVAEERLDLVGRGSSPEVFLLPIVGL